MSLDQIEYYKEAYNLFDADHNGSIDVYELGEVMRSCGLDPTDEEVRNMIASVDVDQTGTIDFDEFMIMMEDFRGETRLHYTPEKLEEAFKAMDFDGNGYISAADLVAVVKGHGDELSEKEALEMIREGDADGDGQINFDDFCKTIDLYPDPLDDFWLGFPQDYRQAYVESRLRNNLTELTRAPQWSNPNAPRILCSEIGQLIKLTDLSLRNCSFCCPIPKEIGNLANLVVLNLGSNNLSGCIPDEFGGLGNLQHLRLDDNRLEGQIPESLCADGNSFSGEIPAEIGELTRLKYLDLSENQLVGVIPESFSNLQSLQRINLRCNSLSGQIPGSVVGSWNCEVINLEANQFTGQPPLEIWSLPLLEVLELARNPFDAYEIPAQVQNMVSLTLLDLSETRATGYLPLELCNLRLEELYLEGTDVFKMVDAEFLECASFWPLLKEAGFYSEQMNLY
ncbi:UNVERIFIED_CONTAM: calmodulin-like 3 [Siphonaria sp. JEL0065]|nr:calmodulin-like 3 [Siphonaria sp. JEL0065]